MESLSVCDTVLCFRSWSPSVCVTSSALSSKPSPSRAPCQGAWCRRALVERHRWHTNAHTHFLYRRDDNDNERWRSDHFVFRSQGCCRLSWCCWWWLPSVSSSSRSLRWVELVTLRHKLPVWQLSITDAAADTFCLIFHLMKTNHCQ